MSRWITLSFLFSVLLMTLRAQMNEVDPAGAQIMLNNIIRFSSVHARDTYTALLKRREPNVEVSFIDTLFIGAITRHQSIAAFDSETRDLERLFAAGSPTILSYERDQEFTASTFSIQTQEDAPWHLDRIDQRELPLNGKFTYAAGPSGDVNVYVLDTGIRVSHEEFEGRARGAYSSLSGYDAGEDCNGHGSHVAGIVGGKTYGVNKRATLYDVRVLNCRGSGSTSGIISAMDWVAKNHKKPAVVNMSLGGSFSSTMNTAIKAMFDAGILAVVAAGNESEDACRKSPASAPDATTVGSMTKTDARSSFSNFGDCVDVYGPGSSIMSVGIKSDTSTAVLSGTSMASPVVCGVASAILANEPNLSPKQLNDKVIEMATQDVPAKIRPLTFLEILPTECRDGFVGIGCEIPLCYGIPGNDTDQVCSGNGECTDVNTCTCKPGYFGDVCEAWKCFGRDIGDPETCSGAGSCVSPNLCECREGYQGSQCEFAPLKTCFGRGHQDPLVCSGHGDCVGTDECQCEDNYSGEECSQFTCFGQDPFTPGVCSGNGICIDHNTCKCDSGFSGEECEELTGQPKSLNARIDGPILKVVDPHQSDLSLDASWSFDPQAEVKAENFQWRCQTIRSDSRSTDKCSSIDVEGAEKKLTVKKETLKDLEGQTLVFTLIYQKGTRSAQASNIVRVQSCGEWKATSNCHCV